MKTRQELAAEKRAERIRAEGAEAFYLGLEEYVNPYEHGSDVVFWTAGYCGAKIQWHDAQKKDGVTHA